MKILIWGACLFVYSLITTLLKQNGIMLGGIPTLILACCAVWVARTLCKKFDEPKNEE